MAVGRRRFDELLQAKPSPSPSPPREQGEEGKKEAGNEAGLEEKKKEPGFLFLLDAADKFTSVSRQSTISYFASHLSADKFETAIWQICVFQLSYSHKIHHICIYTYIYTIV